MPASRLHLKCQETSSPGRRGRQSTTPSLAAPEGSAPGWRLYLVLLILVVSVSAIYWKKYRELAPAAKAERVTEGQDQIHQSQVPEGEAATSSPAPETARLGHSVWQIVTQLIDEAVPIKDRRRAARSLVETHPEKALEAARIVLANGPPYSRAAMAESLGQCTDPDALDLLTSLAAEADETTARGAIRGLVQRGEGEALGVLGQVLLDPGRPESVRAEAALGLGDLPGSEALAAQLRAAREVQDANVVDAVLEGLGKRPFAETAQFFRDYLESGAADESKAVALEALGQAEGEAGPLLLQYAQHENPGLRAAAVWALSSREASEAFGPSLIVLLQQEPLAAVRLRLYQALENQSNCDWRSILPVVRIETEPGARLEGFALLAQLSQAASERELREFLEQTVVPAARALALESTNPSERLAAVMVLQRTRLADSAVALQEITRFSGDSRVVAAARIVSHAQTTAAPNHEPPL